MGADATNLSFRVSIPEQQDLGFVQAIVFLSPTGRWADRTRVAFSELIPVEAARLGGGEGKWPDRILKAYAPEPVASPKVRQSTAVQTATVLLFLGSALLVRGRPWIREVGDGSTNPPRWRRHFLFWALLLGAASEAFSPGEVLVNRLRAAALVHGRYNEREPLQQALTLAVALSAVLWGLRSGRGSSPLPLRVAWAAWAGWLGVAATGALSLHAIDRLDATEVAGFSTLQAVRLVAATVAFAAAWVSASRPDRGPAGSAEGC